MIISLSSIPHIGEFTKIPLNLFFVYGFCVYRWKPSEKKKHLQIIFFLSFIVLVNLDFVGMVAYILFDSLETSVEKTAYVIYTTFAGNALMKLACCFYNKTKLRTVLKNLHEKYPKTAQERKDYKLDEHLQRIRKYNRSLTIYHMCVSTMFNMFPLMQSIVVYYQNDKKYFPYELPFPMVYFWNKKTNLGYAVAYFAQVSGSYMASCAFLGSDLLLATCVHLVNMNFAYLNKSIIEFKPNGTSGDMEKLKKLIKYHDDILTTVELIDETFNISILLNYVGTVIMICLLGFQVVIGTSFLDLIKFLSFLISVLTHVYIISVFGTEMITLSEDVSNAFTYHSWFDGSMAYKRAIVLPIARAQRPAILHASKFFIISMETFKSLVSISYQFFTLIKTRYEEN